jgi:hypothetical protein
VRPDRRGVGIYLPPGWLVHRHLAASCVVGMLPAPIGRMGLHETFGRLRVIRFPLATVRDTRSHLRAPRRTRFFSTHFQAAITIPRLICVRSSSAAIVLAVNGTAAGWRAADRDVKYAVSNHLGRSFKHVGKSGTFVPPITPHFDLSRSRHYLTIFPSARPVRSYPLTDRMARLP